MKQLITLGICVAMSLTSSALFAKESPKHLEVAEDLLSKVDVNNTNYEHGEGTVIWDGPAQSRTDCSGFIDHLLMHTYGYSRDDFKRWFDSRRPTARRYHDAIAEQKGFTQLSRPEDLRPGDLIAIKYFGRTDNTGHIMLVAGKAEQIAAKKPFVEGTTQWAVKIIDSSMSGHGNTDTRHKRGHSGKDRDGLGQGIFRLYTDTDGKIAGFTWSTQNASKFMKPEDEHVVLGRLVPNYQP